MARTDPDRPARPHRPPHPAPGLVVVAILAAIVTGAATTVPVSGLVLAVVAGAAWANTIGVSELFRPGVGFAGRVLLRLGIVVLGLRLSLGDIADLGGRGLAVVALTVAATFFGTQALGRRLGLGRDLSLLVATGFSICGASAIAAMEPNSDAAEEDVAASIGLVTLFGTLAMFSLPAIAGWLALGDSAAGSWIGASTHDVAQVVAGAQTISADALSAAVVVKLTRVALLAPLVAGVAVARRRRCRSDTDDSASMPPVLPLFVVGFLAAAALRSTGVLSADVLSAGQHLEKGLLTAAMVGLGAGVRIGALRALGPRPLLLGALAWLVVAGVSLAGVALFLA